MTDLDPREWEQEEWVGVAILYLLAGFVLIPELLLPIPVVIAGYAFFWARDNEDYEHRPGVMAAVAFIGVLILIGAGHAIIPGGPSMDTSNTPSSQAESSTVTTTVAQTSTPKQTLTTTITRTHTAATVTTTTANADEEDDDESHAEALYVAKKAAEGAKDDRDYNTLTLKEETDRGWKAEGIADSRDPDDKKLHDEPDKYGSKPESTGDDYDTDDLKPEKEDSDGDGTLNGEDEDSPYYTGNDGASSGGSSGSSGDDDGIGDDDDDWGWGR